MGTRVELEHLRPTPVGETVAVAAELVHVDGRLLRFEVVVTDDADVVVGRALITLGAEGALVFDGKRCWVEPVPEVA